MSVYACLCQEVSIVSAVLFFCRPVKSHILVNKLLFHPKNSKHILCVCVSLCVCECADVMVGLSAILYLAARHLYTSPV